jgi:hypothetical protein
MHACERMEVFLESYQPVRFGPAWAGQQRCSQFFRRMAVQAAVGTLRNWDVPFTMVEQQAGKLVVTAPGAIHQSWNGGMNTAISANWSDGSTRLRMVYNKACHAN